MGITFIGSTDDRDRAGRVPRSPLASFRLVPDTLHFHSISALTAAPPLRAVLSCSRSTGTSAAQNGPVIRICPKCGALLLDNTDSCSFCSAEASERNEFLGTSDARSRVSRAAASPSKPVAAQPRGSAAAAAAAPALDPDASAEIDWRDEVSRRLEQYRARRGHLRPNDAQSGLPFREPPPSDEPRSDAYAVNPGAIARERRAVQAQTNSRPRTEERQRKPERVEIRVQPELDFSASSDDRAHPQTALVPVAALSERRWSAALDAIFLVFTCAGFLGLFRSLGGEITAGKTDILVYVVAAYSFYGFYVSLFTVLAGSTPGMQLRGLAVVRLDGSLPDTRQLLWRSFGYLLSGATFLLGFIWALWDEDRFTWQDRISQTYVTAAVPIADFDAFDVSAAGHRFAHK